MKLSTRGRYGLRALIDLAVHESDGAVSAQSIAQSRKLKQDGLVDSVRGAGGGYRLAKPAEEISVGSVLRSLEGNLDAVECPAIEGNPCNGADACVTKFVWKRINDAISQAVDGIMISELAEESRALLEKQPGRQESVEKRTC